MPNNRDSHILFIAGAMRSGSTLLGMLLGRLPGFFNAGEIKWFWPDALHRRARCECGVSVQDCPFWSEVIMRLEQEGVDISRIAQLHPKLTRTKDIPFIWLRQQGAWQSAIWDEFVSAHDALYRITSELAGGRVVIDASKMPPHLMLLKSLEAVRFGTIHLVRDGRGVAYSWEKRYKAKFKTNHNYRASNRSAYKSLLMWLMQNELIEYMLKSNQRRTLVRYEDFVLNPEDTLRETLKALKFNYDSDGHPLIDDSSFPQSHSLGGSDQVRFATGSQHLVLDEVWRKRMKSSKQNILYVLAIPLLRRYGYSRNKNTPK